MAIVTKRIVCANYKITLTAEDIIRLIRKKAPALDIPLSAVVSVRVPSGGDYSGMDLDNPEINICWSSSEDD